MLVIRPGYTYVPYNVYIHIYIYTYIYICTLSNLVQYSNSYIDSVIEVNGTYYTKQVKPILSHYNYVHCGNNKLLAIMLVIRPGYTYVPYNVYIYIYICTLSNIVQYTNNNKYQSNKYICTILYYYYSLI